MELDKDFCYKALTAHDTRFDGVIFVGVSSTGIYCRPVCPAKTPKYENCTFFRSAAAAERAGYRPCLRCRPELAPGNASVDAVGRLAAAAASAIEDGALAESSVEDLAATLGVSDRHLRRAVEREFGVSPIQLDQTQRLLTAKRLLTDTDLSITEVAFASGFASLRRFNALFKERYRLNPTALRKTASRTTPDQTITCQIAYRPPMDWDSILTFLKHRAMAGVEMVHGDRYIRTARIGKSTGWISVSPAPNASRLNVKMSISLASALIPVLARIKRVFDVAANPQHISEHLGELAASNPGLRVPGSFDGFETALRAILGQQISVRAATTLSCRFAQRFGECIETPFEELTFLSPTAEQVAAASVEEIRALGLVNARARTIQCLAQTIADGGLSLRPTADVDQTIESLKALPGIGEWTAQYIVMRALGWPDAFPHTDLGVYKALNETNPKRVLAMAEAWRPWRSYATMHLWKSLENL